MGNEEKVYVLSLIGCDDTTVMKIRMNQEQKEFIKHICDLSEQKSECICMPTMKLSEAKSNGE